MSHNLQQLLGKDAEVVLASKSPRRKQICEEELGIKNLRIVGSQFPEDLDKSLYTPFEYVVQTAIRKALDVYQSEADSDVPPALVLAADTIIADNDGLIMEKPRGVDHHVAMLRKLRDSKKPHRVFTGVIAIVPFEKPIVPGYALESYLGESTVEFKKDLTEEELLNYVASGEASDAAGGYKIQGELGKNLVEKYTGELSNIVGLPVKGTFELVEKTMKVAMDCDSEDDDEEYVHAF